MVTPNQTSLYLSGRPLWAHKNVSKSAENSGVQYVQSDLNASHIGMCR